MMVIISAAIRMCEVKYISNFMMALFVLTINMSSYQNPIFTHVISKYLRFFV